jgi:hypothetical protein
MTTTTREQILETIKGFEPVGHLDGTSEQNVIPAGYDLDKDLRTEFGFYWEYEDMEACADKIMNLVNSYATTLAEEASRTARMDELKLLQNFLVKHHLYDQDAAMKLNYHFKERLAELAPQKESE